MAYIDFWRRWRDFSGRTGRSEYWTALFVHLFLSFFLMITFCIIFVAVLHLSVNEAITYFNVFWRIYGLIWFVPFLSMTVRRFRDAGYNKTNFWMLFIPGIGILALFTKFYDTENKESDK